MTVQFPIRWTVATENTTCHTDSFEGLWRGLDLEVDQNVMAIRLRWVEVKTISVQEPAPWTLKGPKHSTMEVNTSLRKEKKSSARQVSVAGCRQTVLMFKKPSCYSAWPPEIYDTFLEFVTAPEYKDTCLCMTVYNTFPIRKCSYTICRLTVFWRFHPGKPISVHVTDCWAFSRRSPRPCSYHV